MTSSSNDDETDDEVDQTNIEESYEKNDDFLDKNANVWYKVGANPPVLGRASDENIFKKQAGIKPFARNRIGSILDSWKLLFTDKMLTKIIHATNEKAREKDVNLN